VGEKVMIEMSLEWEGKYLGLLRGFTYKNGRKHPEFNWVKMMPQDTIDKATKKAWESVDVSKFGEDIDSYERTIIRTLIAIMEQEWKELILSKSSEINTISWYDWEELASSVSIRG
jgi:hypothetical protein